MTVDLAPLRSAIDWLDEALQEHRSNPASTVIRDGLIQRFEFTYDLAPKMLRRVLAIGADTPADIDTMTFAP